LTGTAAPAVPTLDQESPGCPSILPVELWANSELASPTSKTPTSATIARRVQVRCRNTVPWMCSKGVGRGTKLGPRGVLDADDVREGIGEVNRGHGTASDLSLGRLAVSQGGRQQSQGLGQEDLQDWGIPSLSHRTVLG
jgi:hypothetical protein